MYGELKAGYFGSFQKLTITHSSSRYLLIIFLIYYLIDFGGKINFNWSSFSPLEEGVFQ